jgi:hypothetical protein
MLEFWDEIQKNDKQVNYSCGLTQTKQQSWLVQSWNTFGAHMNHGQT